MIAACANLAAALWGPGSPTPSDPFPFHCRAICLDFERGLADNELLRFCRKLLAELVPGVMAVYNRGSLLPEAALSVLAQSYRPIEIIIVDDGFTDPETLLEIERPSMCRPVAPASGSRPFSQLPRKADLGHRDSALWTLGARGDWPLVPGCASLRTESTNAGSVLAGRRCTTETH